jgi:penicillin-binding protein 1C
VAAPLMFRIFGFLPADAHAPPAVPQMQAAGLKIFGATRPDFSAGPKILFPPDGAILQVTDGAPVSLEASGGAPPYRWVVNGKMLPAAPVGENFDWQPDGPGFAHIVVIDKNEATASEDVQMR